MVDNFVSYNNNSRICSILSGIPGFNIKDIKLSNIFIQHQGGDYADLVKSFLPKMSRSIPTPACSGRCPRRVSSSATSTILN